MTNDEEAKAYFEALDYACKPLLEKWPEPLPVARLVRKTRLKRLRNWLLYLLKLF